VHSQHSKSGQSIYHEEEYLIIVSFATFLINSYRLNVWIPNINTNHICTAFSPAGSNPFAHILDKSVSFQKVK